MNRIGPLAVGTAIVLGLLIPGIGAGDKQTLTGGYRWNAGAEDALRAEFTPTGDGTWEVDFHFKMRGKKHVYSGTAEGSLTEGELKGTVKNEGRSRTFTFEGAFEDGTFHGTHAEIGGGEAHPTGTMTLG